MVQGHPIVFLICHPLSIRLLANRFEKHPQEDRMEILAYIPNNELALSFRGVSNLSLSFFVSVRSSFWSVKIDHSTFVKLSLYFVRVSEA